MKQVTLSILLLLTTLYALATEENIVKAPLTNVTVYAQGAQLFHKASFTAKSGLNTIIIEGISPTIDPNSIQVKVNGNGILLDSKYSLYYPTPDEISAASVPAKLKRDIQLLEDSIAALSYDIKDVQDEIDVLNYTKNILANNGAVRGQGKVNDSINLLKSTIDYYQIKMNELNKKLATLSKSKNAKEKKQTAMQERLNQLYSHAGMNNQPDAKQPIPRITLSYQAKEQGGGKIELSYISTSAGWTPTYDIRSEGLSSGIQLTYKATIFQQTGIDWENVKLSVSTNNPYLNKTKPILHPWYIDYYTYRMDGYSAAPQAIMEVATKRESGYKNVADDAYADAETSKDFVRSIKQLTSVEFQIDLSYSIPSDNQSHLVLLKQENLAATYNYYSVPKLDEAVYLVAEVTNLSELGLVPAAANIFFDGAYIGETYLDPTVMEDTLKLSLGRDPNIQIKRKLDKEACKEKIIGDKKEKRQAYSIEVKNLKASEVNLIIEDQYPITTNAEIEASVGNTDKGKVDETIGSITWTMNLKPKESKTIKFDFTIKYKKDQQLPL